MSLEQLKEIGVQKRYSAHDHIFNEGETGDEMHIILLGKVGVYINSFNDFPIKVAEIPAGGLFGEMSVLEDLPRTASVIALEETITISIGKTNFKLFIEGNPELALKLLKTLSSRIRALNEDLSKLKEGVMESQDVASKEENTMQDKVETEETEEKNEGNAKLETCGDSDILNVIIKKHSITANPEHIELLFDKPVRCPVCEKSFVAKMPRFSKLKPDCMDREFRQKYSNFEPIWYAIWSCPNCYYSNFTREFEEISVKDAKIIEGTRAERVSFCNLTFEEPRDVDHVLSQYFLALKCIDDRNYNYIKKAKIWIRLKWLFKDLDEDEMFKMALENAFECYYNTYYNSRTTIENEHEQQILMILSELYYQRGMPDLAVKHLLLSTKCIGAKEIYKEQAQDRIYEIKGGK